MESGAVALSLNLCSPLTGQSNAPVRNVIHLPRKFQAFEETSNRGRISFRNRNIRRDLLVSQRRRSAIKIPSLPKTSEVSSVSSESIHASTDEAVALKKKAGDLSPLLNQRSIYLVGMMGSGKSTVGRILAEGLGYSFIDSDKLIEEAVGGISVAQIFQQYSESFFRDNESKVLQNLSGIPQLVVATGGGAVIRPVNWRNMKKGVTVWLDVPLEALARRIAAVGTDSRPLLHHESGDPYTKAFTRLSNLFEERGDAYANADVRLCLEYIATKRGLVDVSDLTPMNIAIEAIVGMEAFLKSTTMSECASDNLL